MNIFALDDDPFISALLMCDQHINKMIVESCQLLATAHPIGVAPYKHTHFNHPCAIWVRQSRNNYLWLVQHTFGLLAERKFRWPDRKEHKSFSVATWFDQNVPNNFPSISLTNFAQAMPKHFWRSDPVAAYQIYYLLHKMKFKKSDASWTRRQKPSWLVIL